MNVSDSIHFVQGAAPSRGRAAATYEQQGRAQQGGAPAERRPAAPTESTNAAGSDLPPAMQLAALAPIVDVAQSFSVEAERFGGRGEPTDGVSVRGEYLAANDPQANQGLRSVALDAFMSVQGMNGIDSRGRGGLINLTA